jgi:diguanylate cyclase (GGDEF)-like protein
VRAPSWRTTDAGTGPPRSRAPLSRRFTYRYAFAVAVFVVIAFGSKTAVDASGRRLSGLSEQFGQAATQPARLYAIADLARTVAGQDERSGRVEIDRAAAELSRLSTELVEVQEDRLRTTINPELDTLYNGPGRLAPTIGAIGRAGSTIAEYKDDQPGNATVRADALAVITSDQESARRGLDQALAVYSTATAQQVQAQELGSQIIIGASFFAALAMVFLLFRPMARNIHRETGQLALAEQKHRESDQRQTYRHDLSRALEVTECEEEVLAVVGRAFRAVVPDNPAELFLTNSTNSRLRRVQVSPSRGAGGCPIEGPSGCAAIRRGQAVVYESSGMLNVCPKLAEHEQSACSAVCVPVMFMGNALGVLHAVGPDRRPPDRLGIEQLSTLASETGNRLGILRNTYMTERQASTDPLTGLFNRRTLETRAHTFKMDGQHFSVAMADLDHFKNLNDNHGHDAGDLALRMFASVLRSNLRPEDVIARYGGEEFIVLLPGTTVAEALKALQRLRVSLQAEIAATGGLAFTASWGVTDDSAGETFEAMVSIADAALYNAKRSGRNRIMTDSESASGSSAEQGSPAEPGSSAEPAPQVA